MFIGAIALSLPMLLAACSGDDGEEHEGDSHELTGATVDCKSLGVAAPSRIKDAGKLIVASDLTYKPNEFVKEGTNDAVGMDIDLVRCIADSWGVTLQVDNTVFDSIIPSLTSKKADIIASSLSVTEERKKTIDFVEYFTAGSSIMVRPGNPAKINGIADLCGKNVAVQTGTIQVDEVEEQNGKCGSNEIKVQSFQDNTDVIQAVASKRVDAALMDYPVATYNAKLVEGTTVVGEQFDTGPYGFGIRKDDTTVRDAITASLAAMKKEGQYRSILEYWGLEAGFLK